MLSVERLNTYYDASHVIQDVTFHVGSSEVVALLGRNGAGKTTTLRSIVGLTRPRSGRVTLEGTDITRLPAHEAARLGIGWVPSGRRVFAQLTVAQNLAVAASRSKSGAWTIERVYEAFPKLEALAERRAGHLSGGEQQMLKLARVMLTGPRVLLLDEPSEGLAPLVVAAVTERLLELKHAGMAMLLCEQNAAFAAALADRAYVLEKGRIRAEVSGHDMRKTDVVRSMLGLAAPAPAGPAQALQAVDSLVEYH